MKTAPKQPQKKTLAEAMAERMKSLADARRDKIDAVNRENNRILEEEVMLMTHGPLWKTRYAWEPMPKNEEAEVPEIQESEVRLKAS